MGHIRVQQFSLVEAAILRRAVRYTREIRLYRYNLIALHTSRPLNRMKKRFFAFISSNFILYFECYIFQEQLYSNLKSRVCNIFKMKSL